MYDSEGALFSPGLSDPWTLKIAIVDYFICQSEPSMRDSLHRLIDMANSEGRNITGDTSIGYLFDALDYSYKPSGWLSEKRWMQNSLMPLITDANRSRWRERGETR